MTMLWALSKLSNAFQLFGLRDMISKPGEGWQNYLRGKRYEDHPKSYPIATSRQE